MGEVSARHSWARNPHAMRRATSSTARMPTDTTSPYLCGRRKPDTKPRRRPFPDKKSASDEFPDIVD